jgi:hypothetical protein
MTPGATARSANAVEVKDRPMLKAWKLDTWTGVNRAALEHGGYGGGRKPAYIQPAYPVLDSSLVPSTRLKLQSIQGLLTVDWRE